MPPKGPKWDWENDDGGFTAFDAPSIRVVENAFVATGGSGTARCAMPSGWTYTFDFDNMTQQNMETKKVRNIRRFGPAVSAATTAAETPSAPPAPVAPVVTTPLVWKWLDDKGTFLPYTAADQATLEAFYQQVADWRAIPVGSKRPRDPSNNTVKIGQWTYNFNFLTMEQTNLSTKKVRKIQRSGGEDSDRSAQFGTSGGAAAAADDDDDDGSIPPPKKARSDGAAASGSAATGDQGKSTTANTNNSGNNNNSGSSAPGAVDPHCGMAGKAHVKKEGAVLWQCTLNQTNLGANNNKFYVIQLLESNDAPTQYFVFTRWGRVGVAGQSSLDGFHGSFDAAKSFYRSKFRDKTKNDWDSVANNTIPFTKHDGKYHLMDIIVSGSAAAADAIEDEMATLDTVAPSTLSPALQGLIKMIANKADWERSMKDFSLDTRKMPLGRISKKQIKEAFSYLKQIETELAKTRPTRSVLIEASSMFYTLIPHDYGMTAPPVIADDLMLKNKMDMLDTMSDLEVAGALLKEVKKTGKHPVDSTYASLKCKIEELSPASPDYKRIVEYVANTHGKTHTAYKLTVDKIFCVDREGESLRYEHTSSGIPNKMMLWHGSRTTNFMGILSQGLRIAPPEAPATGYMYGKGVYFADVVTKSGNYCHTSPANPNGILLLCEAALGSMAKFTEAKYMDKPMSGTNSTMGVGKMEPNPEGSEVVDGVIYPKGKMHDTPGVSSSSLLYHEYIVYDTSQCRMRYLIQVKFNYGHR